MVNEGIKSLNVYKRSCILCFYYCNILPIKTKQLVSQHKPPRYIRDFMEGINEKDIDVEKFELYLLTLNPLIVKSAQQIKEVVLSFFNAKVF